MSLSSTHVIAASAIACVAIAVAAHPGVLSLSLSIGLAILLTRVFAGVQRQKADDVVDLPDPEGQDVPMLIEARFTRIRDVDLAQEGHYLMQACLRHAVLIPSNGSRQAPGSGEEPVEEQKVKARQSSALLASTPAFSAAELKEGGEGALLGRATFGAGCCASALHGLTLDLELVSSSNPGSGAMENGSCPTGESDHSARRAPLCRRTLQLRGGLDGFHSTVPVVFDVPGHFCVVEVKLLVTAAESGPRSDQSTSEPSRIWPPMCPGGWVLATTPHEAVAHQGPLNRQHLACFTAQGSCNTGRWSGDLPGGKVVCRCLGSEESTVPPTLLENVAEVARGADALDTSASGDNSAGLMGGHLIAVVPCPNGDGPEVQALLNYLAAVLPGAHITSFSTTHDQCQDLHRAGVRLAQQLSEQLRSVDAQRLSFVAWGIGGLLVRAAVPWMQEHAGKFSVLMTLATPHLGLRPGSLDWRTWLLGMAKKTLRPRGGAQLLKQLELADGRNSCESLLYRLSGDNCIGHFHSLVLVAVCQDALTPLPSTLLEGTCDCDGGSKGASEAGHGSSIADSATSAATSSSGRFARFRSKWTSSGLPGWLAPLLFCAALIIWLLVRYRQQIFVFVPGQRWPRLFRLALLGAVVIYMKLKGLRNVMRSADTVAALQGRASPEDQASKQGPVEHQMTSRILLKTHSCRVTRARLDVRPGAFESSFAWCAGLKRLIDGCRGRTCMLQSQKLARTVAYAYGGLFEASPVTLAAGTSPNVGRDDGASSQ